VKFLGRQYQRKQVPLGERVASFSILFLLVGIGIALAVKSTRFDPNRFALRAEALASTVDDPGLAATAPSLGAGLGARSGSAQANAPQPALADSGYGDASAGYEGGEDGGSSGGSTPSRYTPNPLDFNVAGLPPLGAAEHYNRDNLYEKIDGRADQYLVFALSGMSCRTFGVDGQAAQFIDLYVFDMGAPTSAFGIYAIEQDPNGAPLDFVADGYRSDASYFYRRGPWYIQVIASDATGVLRAGAESLARAVAAALPEDNRGLEAVDALPKTGRRAGSIRFEMSNAFSYSFFNHVFSADYDFEGRTLKFFLMNASDAAAAQAVYDKYFDLGRQMGVTPQPERNIQTGAGAAAPIAAAENFGKWDVLFHDGARVGGVWGADSREAAEKFAADFLKGTLK
jgi:hypothetical protein